MNVLLLLAGVLLILMVAVGGINGVRSFISLFLNGIILLVTVFFMLDTQTNILLLTLVACAALCAVNLFYINGLNRKTVAAFIATFLTLGMLLSVIYWVTDVAMIQGFSEEETEELDAYNLLIGIDYVQVAAAVIIMSTIGAIMDVAMSITSSMHEYARHTTSTPRQLVAHGMLIGRDILGTDTNTLFFAFFGGYLGLLIWFKDLHYSFGEIVNAKVFGAEVLTIFTAGIGIALVIPMAAWTSVLVSKLFAKGNRAA